MDNPQRKSVDDLHALLRSHYIPTALWGVGEAKTIGHFFTELKNGESVLEYRDGSLVRVINLVTVTVYRVDGDIVWKLREDRQVFKDGRERRRGFERLGEKCGRGESA